MKPNLTSKYLYRDSYCSKLYGSFTKMFLYI